MLASSNKEDAHVKQSFNPPTSGGGASRSIEIGFELPLVSINKIRYELGKTHLVSIIEIGFEFKI